MVAQDFGFSTKGQAVGVTPLDRTTQVSIESCYSVSASTATPHRMSTQIGRGQTRVFLVGLNPRGSQGIGFSGPPLVNDCGREGFVRGFVDAGLLSFLLLLFGPIPIGTERGGHQVSRSCSVMT